ncbi:MAG: NUDIX hydrolase [Pseudonocardiaceae bacterium]|nr:NUDIX hydrolase [Pseudonocardiaceae bacterium]
MTPLLITLGVVVVLVVLRAAVRVANRLDRLHVRTDAAWLALDSALVRRAVVVRTLIAAGGLPEVAEPGLATAAGRTTASASDREAVENELGRMLGALDRSTLDAALDVELADAEACVMLARRVYNDAVRDTRALRTRRVVRWLRLAGTAPWPRYFEIVDPPVDFTPTWQSRSARTRG